LGRGDGWRLPPGGWHQPGGAEDVQRRTGDDSHELYCGCRRARRKGRIVGVARAPTSTGLAVVSASAPRAVKTLASARDQGGGAVRERVAGERVDGNEPRRRRVAARRRLAGEPPAKEHGDQVVRRKFAAAIAEQHLVNVKEARDFGGDAGFLAHLTQGRRPRPFSRLDMPARQTPLSPQGALAAFDQ